MHIFRPNPSMYSIIIELITDRVKAMDLNLASLIFCFIPSGVSCGRTSNADGRRAKTPVFEPQFKSIICFIYY